MTPAAQTWKNLALRPLPAVQDLTRQEYIASYRFKRPVLLRGRAAQRWDAAYLRGAAGDATVIVGHLSKSDPHDFTHRDEESMTLGALLRALEAGAVKENTYLFNSDSSLFLRNPKSPHLGWGAAEPNPGLARLARDFIVPEFIGDDYLFASLILGPAGSGTRLHYDWGGEAKAMIQMRGSKRVMLMPPSMARFIGLSNIFDGKVRGNDALADRPGNDATLPADAWGYAVDLEPGDTLYFPAFWFHKIENSGPVNIAVAVGIDELPSSALAMRLSWYLAARALLAPAGLKLENAGRVELRFDGRRIATLEELLAGWEALLLSTPAQSSDSYWTVTQDLLSPRKRGP